MRILITSIPAYLEVKDTLILSITVGYMAIFTQEISRGYAATGSILAEFIIPGFMFVLAGSRGRTLAVWAISLMVFGYSVALFIIFAAISYVVVAGYMFLRAAGQSVSPRMARYYSEGDEKKFVGITLLVMGLSATIGIVGVLAIAVAGKQILTVIYTAEYANDTRTFLWMMVVSGLSFMVSALGFAITSARYFWSQVPLLMVSSGSTALACWWLVPDLVDLLRGDEDYKLKWNTGMVELGRATLCRKKLQWAVFLGYQGINAGRKSAYRKVSESLPKRFRPKG